MSVQIKTRHLLDLLKDLQHTASKDDHAGASRGILLHTDRGYVGDDVGQTQLLIGTSTNGKAVGQTYVPVDGAFAEPMLWTLEAIRTVVSVLQPKLADKEHQITLTRDLATCTVQEPPDLFDDGDKFTFHLGDLTKYPRYLWDYLEYETPDTLPEDGKGGYLPVLPRTDLTVGSLAPFVAVAKARHSVIQMYRTHQDRVIMIQIGETYRGALMPLHWTRDEPRPQLAGTRPDGQVYVPDLPPPAKDTARPALTVITTGGVDQPPLPVDEDFVDEDLVDGQDSAPGKPAAPVFADE